MNPLVSVIIPLYNSVDSIKTCIESIESQTYTNIEVVIIDDGSLTEYKALQEAKAYTEQTAIKAWTLRTAKAAITNLRMFVAYGLKRNPEYDEMLRFARTHLISYQSNWNNE